MRRLKASVLAAFWISAACLAADLPAQRPTPARVLFIGNSLTYVNNLPAMVEAVARQAGAGDRLRCRGVAKPNVGLEDHWNDGEALRGIEMERWTHVVLQQGPTSRPESRAALRKYAKKFAGPIRMRGARPVLYGVWMPRAQVASLEAVTESYALAAADVEGDLVPVGEGWRAALRRNPQLPLYAPDNFHPSPMGTYLAALMFVEYFTGRSPIGLPAPSTSTAPGLRELTIGADDLAILQQAAAEANAGVRRPARIP
jgi:hypothetical protein